MPRPPASRRWAARAIRIAVLLALCDLAASLAYLDTALSMNPERSAARWEAAVVLFSDFDAHGGVDEETLRRLNVARNLYREEAVSLILCSGGARPSSARYGSNGMRKYLIEQGVPEGRVVEERRSNHTRRNILESQHALQRMGLSRAVIVSSPVHLPRLRHLVSCETGISFDLSAYRLRDGEPPVRWASLYGQIHHELAAWLVEAVLSDENVKGLIDLLRQ